MYYICITKIVKVFIICNLADITINRPIKGVLLH